MCKKGLLRTSLLVILLVVALAVIVITMRANITSATIKPVQTQTFFEQFIIAGSPIVWFILLPMSLITVYLAAEHCLTIRRKKLLPRGIGARTVETIRQFGPGQLEARIGDRNDFVSIAAAKAAAAGGADWFRMRNAFFESLQEQSSCLIRRIEWLNLIGNVSPMVGLFGTVFGMIKLFNAIVTAGGQPQPAQLADGISVALVTTFWGLFIAIPALAIHGVFRNRIETLVSDAVVEAENIVPEIRRSMKKQSQAEPQQESKRKLSIQELPAKPTKTIGKSLHSR